jgi:hypothetical protein
MLSVLDGLVELSAVGGLHGNLRSVCETHALFGTACQKVRQVNRRSSRSPLSQARGGNAEIEFGASRGGWVEALGCSGFPRRRCGVVQCVCARVRATGRERSGASHTFARCAHLLVGVRGVARYVCACSGVVRCVRVCAARRCSTPSNGALRQLACIVPPHTSSRPQPPVPLPHSPHRWLDGTAGLPSTFCTSTSPRADALRDDATRVTHELGAPRLAVHLAASHRTLGAPDPVGSGRKSCQADHSQRHTFTTQGLGRHTRLVASYGVHAP